jgi:hypothetical protein
LSDIIQEKDVPTEEEMPIEDSDIFDEETPEEGPDFDRDEFETNTETD